MNEENMNLNENSENTEAVENTETAQAPEAPLADNTANTASKSKPTALIIGAIVLIVVIAIAIICKMYGSNLFNKYNRMGFVDTTGQTVGEVADMMGMSYEEFLEEYRLPKDMPPSTIESAAYYMVPAGKVAEQYGVDFETLKAELGFADEITEDSTWADAEGTIKLGNYIPEEQFDMFKEYYGFGDDVTVDTLWKDVRHQIDMKQREEMLAQQEAMKEAEKAAEEAGEEDAQEIEIETGAADGAAETAVDTTAADAAVAQ